MKVLMINSVCGVGSTGKICVDALKALEENGHECRIAYGRKGAPDWLNNRVVRIGSPMGVRMHAFLSRIFDTSGFHSKWATKKLIKWIKNYDPDVIHLHNLHGYYVNVEILFDYLKTCGKKIVWTLHDCWAFTGHCSHFECAGCDKWMTECNACSQKKEYPKSSVFSRAKKNYYKKKKAFTGVPNLTVITPSKWLCDTTKKSFLSGYDIKVINNGIDLSVFKPTPSDFRKENDLLDKFVVLGVADYFGERKGINDFIKLKDLLSDKYQLVLVGRVDDEKALDGILHVKKTATQIDLAKIYSSSDVFVNFTKEDTFPTVNTEALACGTPVITYKTGGAPEIIDEGCGAKIEKGDLISFRDEIIKACEGKIYTAKACTDRAKAFDKDERTKEILETVYFDL